MEELGYLFRNDPMFEQIFNLPYGCLKKVVEKRKLRIEQNPIGQILPTA